MPTGSLVKQISNGTLIISGVSSLPIKTIKVEKLTNTPAPQPLDGSNPVHPARFICHAIATAPIPQELKDLVDEELPVIKIKDSSDNEEYKFSQATIIYIDAVSEEIKIVSTHFR